MKLLFGKYSGEVVDDDDETQRGAAAGEGARGVRRARGVGAALPALRALLHPAGRDEACGSSSRAATPAYPIWVGTWYADGEVPAAGAGDAAGAAGAADARPGHTVELDDTPGAERVLIKPQGRLVRVRGRVDGSVLVANQKGANLYLNAAAGEATLTASRATWSR